MSINSNRNNNKNNQSGELSRRSSSAVELNARSAAVEDQIPGSKIASASLYFTSQMCTQHVIPPIFTEQ